MVIADRKFRSSVSRLPMTSLPAVVSTPVPVTSQVMFMDVVRTGRILVIELLNVTNAAIESDDVH